MCSGIHVDPDWTVESMLYANSTMTAEFPTLLGKEDNGTSRGLERWLYLTQALQTRCVGGSIENYRQHSEVMGSLNWAINSIWIGPAWGSISHDGALFPQSVIFSLMPDCCRNDQLKAGSISQH